MAMKIDRSALRKGIGAAQSRSEATKDEGRGIKSYVLKNTGRPIFKKLPEGTTVFDIIPFIFTDKFGSKYAKGDVGYVLEVWAHTNVGINKDMILCPYQNFGEPCPICDEFARLRGMNADWETQLKPLKPKKRVLYNIWIHDKDKKLEGEGVHLFECAHFTLEEKLLAISTNPEDGGVITFSDPDEGKKIAVNRKGTKQDNTVIDGHRFIDRKKPIPDAILEEAVPLNEAVEILDAEEIARIFLMGSSEAEEDSPRRSAGKPSKSKYDDDDDDDDDTPVNRAKAKKKPTKEDDEDDDEDDEPEEKPKSSGRVKRKPEPEPDDDDDEDEPEEKPKRGRSAKKADPEPDDDDDEPEEKPKARKKPKPEPEEDDEDEPEEKPKASKKATRPAKKDSAGCPGGGTFGEDVDKFKECKTCTRWEECGDEYDKNNN